MHSFWMSQWYIVTLGNLFPIMVTEWLGAPMPHWFHTRVTSLPGPTWHLDEMAKAWLADKGYDPVYGARPLKRVIQRELQNPLAQKILEGSIPDGSTVHIGASPLGLMIGEAAPGTIPGAMAAQ